MSKETDKRLLDGKTADISGFLIIVTTLIMFMADGFSYATVSETIVIPLLLTAGALILRVQKPFKKAG